MSFFKKWWKTFRWHYKERHFRRFRNMSNEEIFSAIYKENMWGGKKGEFFSGDGTHFEGRSAYIETVVSFIKEHNIQAITEVGCGDFAIMRNILAQVPEVKYTGLDVVPDLVAHNNAQFKSASISFQVTDAVNDPLPGAELIIIRQVLQHLKNAAVAKVLEKVKIFNYALITEHVPITKDVEPNLDKSTGPHIRTRINSGLFIDLPPFSMPNTSVLLDSRRDETIKGKIMPAVIRTYLVRNV